MVSIDAKVSACFGKFRKVSQMFRESFAAVLAVCHKISERFGKLRKCFAEVSQLFSAVFHNVSESFANVSGFPESFRKFR